ncbi:MAG: putative lipopolysaccharide heptosyltransferase III [Hydrogenophilales bacterium CG17_big_fil_post_rev_8_21_14_2_50_63_12]|nr:MAG: putative lipopolysaccharide heptosyltransferase III [Hydrogenophilales bacterium CG17_big_fil_post_rev_8_21_14_2_50_63_12]PIX97942.1 MAG: putative lipopolysaccharide heptosyltransferase III [Hydrogenophilales bacterium CG_4_10_14_3_um_filter_63_21]
MRPGKSSGLLNLPPFFAAFTPLSINDTPDLSRIRRVLVTKLRHHGDVLLASPVLGALKRHLPEAEIDALVYRDTRDMLARHPALSQLHLVAKGGNLREEWRLLQSLRSRRYDLLVHLTSSSRGAWLARLLKPAVSVAPSHPGKLYRNSFTHLYRHANARPIVECNLDALRRIGLWPEEQDKKLVLVAGEEADRSVAKHLRDLGLEAGKFILIHPTSRWVFKCWPGEKVAELARRLNEMGYPLLFSSGPDAQETGMVTGILARLSFNPPSLAGRLTLKELAAVLARARLFIGMDSAPMHMAAAVGTPVVALFGPSGADIWGPWQVPSRVITSEHTCRPCGFDGCGGSKRSDCLEIIPVERVLDATLELLEKTR